MLKRREVLAAGLAGGSLWAAGGLGIAHAQVVPPVSALDAASMAILRVFTPIILGDGAFPTDATARTNAIAVTAQRAGSVVSDYPALNQATIQSIFARLKQGPQSFNPNFPATWETVPAPYLVALLEGLRVNTDPNARGIYSVLFGIIPNGHYSNPANWAAINYPGPPRIV